MRLRLLRRRLTVSAPRVAVRSAMPWPLRWVIVALVFGFCAAIALWAFEFGREIAGLDRSIRDEVLHLREEVATARSERDKAQSIANTADSVLAAERAARDALHSQVRKLEAENQALRDDLGFFQTLMPLASGGENLVVRGLQAEALPGQQLRWKALLVQVAKGAPEFSGSFDLTIAGTENGRPWTMPIPGGAKPVRFQQYRRLEGQFDLPPDAVVKTVTVRLLDSQQTVRATQIFKFQP